MKMNRAVLSVLMLFSAGLLLSFQNCSKVNFAVDMESLRGKLSAAGGIVINNDDPATNSSDVQLTLIHDSAQEMYISNAADCSQGDWEPYAPNKPWKLSANNASVAVYAKYRTEGIETDCLKDDILHDDIAPKVDITKPVSEFINVKTAAIEFTATDAGSGVKIVNCASDGASAVDKCVSNGNHSISNLLDGAHSIRVVAKDGAGNVSDPVDVPFTVDTVKPVVVINTKPAKITGDVNSSFTFTGTDDRSGIAAYKCAFGSDPMGSCSSPISRVLNGGDKTFAVMAIDKAGNESTPEVYAWTIDVAAPILQFTKKPDPFSKDPVGNFEFTGTDGGKPITNFECRLDAGAYAKCSSPHNTASLPDGSHTLYVRGKDDQGNMSEPISHTWTIDTKGPSVAINTHPDDATKSRSAPFTFTASDDRSGVKSVECQIDGSGYKPCSSQNAQSYANLVDGKHLFEVRATDNALNVGSPAKFDWIIDNVKPTIDITSGPDALTKKLVAAFEMQAQDNAEGSGIDHLECKLDNAANFEACTSPKNYSALLDIPHLFSARAVDKAGNVSDVKTYSWVIDITGPAINVSKQPLSTIGMYVKAIIDYSVTDSPAGVDSVRCGLKGNLSPCNNAQSIDLGTLTPGNYSYVIEAKDKLGNESSKEILWVVENNTVDKTQDIDVKSNNKVDILVVIDNSGSMAYEQLNMKNRFATFIDQLKGLNWQIGIVTTDLSANADLKDGRLIKYVGLSPDQYVVTSAMDSAAAKKAFGDTIQRSESGSSDEQGIGAAYRAIERAKLNDTAINKRNTGLFRTDAALAVLVVTDADETPGKNGTQPRNVPENLVQLVRDTWSGQKAFSYHAIIVKSGDKACAEASFPVNNKAVTNEGEGKAYEQIAALTGGVIGSVCAADYGSQLSEMGKASAGLVRSATLDCMPLDTNNDGKPDLSVMTADSSPAPAFTIDGLKVTFDKALPNGLNRLSYSCVK